MRLRSTVRFLEFKDCWMNINDLVTFIRPFTNLKSLSFWGLYVAHDKKLEKRGRLPVLKGQLDPDFAPRADWSFLHELSLLPLAFRDITLRNHTGLRREVNRLLTASRKTLVMIRVVNRHRDFLDLKNFNALEGLQLDASGIDYISLILQTITSNKFRMILLTLSNCDLERHLKYPRDTQIQRWWGRLAFMGDISCDFA
ncbi:hypothetical protein BDM02DRAFT_848802 [Thelephora ganbajun]|uniref:Uncharacterized protein n=1 Tax=Thelephora ganbajun TaxID=370292 RepID=A0ACB6Z5J1_THEGA|nr:hypothetical protein BDM02DRAFT_848802 [Thelephora ganbajun]